MKRIILFGLLLFAGFQLLAQPNANKNAKMEERLASMRIAYITQKLDLSPKESQVFWPVYNEFTKSLEEIKRALASDKDPKELTEAEAKVFLEHSVEKQREELNLKLNYIERLSEVLSAKKIVLLIHAEREFRRDILKETRRKNKDSRSNLRRKN